MLLESAGGGVAHALLPNRPAIGGCRERKKPFIIDMTSSVCMISTIAEQRSRSPCLRMRYLACIFSMFGSCAWSKEFNC